MKTLVGTTLLVLVFLDLAFSMPKAVTYIFTIIDNPDADTVHGERTRAFGINDPVQIVGDFGRHGFVFSRGIFTTIDVPSASLTQAFDMQNREETAIQVEAFFDDRDEHINGECRPDLSFDGVLESAVERLDAQVLFDPAKDVNVFLAWSRRSDYFTGTRC